MSRLQIAAVLLLTTACSDPPPPWPEVKNVVFITIDTLRADHTSAYGYPVRTTPFLEQMAAQGVTFDRAYAHSSTTAPSHSSMFTGLYPIQHRVQTNGQKLDGRFTTLASHLAAAGWRTGAFVSAPALFDGSNVRRGFTDYDSPPESHGHPGRNYRPANETIEAAARWLRRSLRQDDPFLLWVHLYDPHSPLRPPIGHLRAIRPRDPVAGEARRALMRSRFIDQSVPGIRREVLAYDAEVLFADTELRRLFRTASANGALDSTLWVITSDHGQGLETHGWFGHHVQIYNTELHIPLIFVFPGNWQAGRRVTEELVSHVDLTPTLLEVLGVQAMSQASPIQGRSMTSLFLDDPAWGRETVFSERRVQSRAAGTRAANEDGTRQSLQTLVHKYILFSEGPDEYYALDTDPYEQHNLIEQADVEARRLRDMLTTLNSTLAGNFDPESVSAAELDQLRAMGYVR